LLVGASGFVIDLFILYLLQYFGFNFLISRLFSFFIAVSYTWFVNSIYTFSDGHLNCGLSLKRYITYCGTSLLGGFINIGVYSFIMLKIPTMVNQVLIAFIAGVSAGLFVNYGISKYYTFAPPPIKD
jgi:putative flippase GtrA